MEGPGGDGGSRWRFPHNPERRLADLQKRIIHGVITDTGLIWITALVGSSLCPRETLEGLVVSCPGVGGFSGIQEWMKTLGEKFNVCVWPQIDQKQEENLGSRKFLVWIS